MLEIKFSKQLAPLICSGAVDVVDIGVNIGKLPCLVLVHALNDFAVPTRVARFNTIECRQAALMAEALGLVPDEYKELGGVIIGSFFADPIPADYHSPWMYGCDPETSYRVVAPMFLYKPIDGLKQPTFDEARDGFNVMPPAIAASGEELILPVNSKIFNAATVGAEFSVPVTDDMIDFMFCIGTLDRYKVLSLTCGGYRKSFVFEKENGLTFDLDDNGDFVCVYSAMGNNDIILPYFKFVLKKRISKF